MLQVGGKLLAACHCRVAPPTAHALLNWTIHCQ